VVEPAVVAQGELTLLAATELHGNGDRQVLEVEAAAPEPGDLGRAEAEH
jgi:hypothetical protein